MNKVIKVAAAAALVFSVAAPVSAAPIDLSFTGGYVGSTSQVNYNYGDEQILSVSGLTANNNGNLRSVNVTQQGGYGLYTTGNTHGISNSIGMNGNNPSQMLFLDFGQAVSLDTFTLSWGFHNNGVPNYGSVLAYTGGDTLNLSGMGWSDLLSNGFAHAGDANAYKNLHVGQEASVQGGLLSQFWLIGAINPIFGGTSDGLHDSFKLGGISFSSMDVSEVPLPAAAWLFLTGLAGMGWLKKRKAKRDQMALVAA